MAVAMPRSRSRRSNRTVESRTSTASAAVSAITQSRSKITASWQRLSMVAGHSVTYLRCRSASPDQPLATQSRSLVHAVGDESLMTDDCSGNSVLGD